MLLFVIEFSALTKKELFFHQKQFIFKFFHKLPFASVEIILFEILKIIFNTRRFFLFSKMIVNHSASELFSRSRSVNFFQKSRLVQMCFYNTTSKIRTNKNKKNSKFIANITYKSQVSLMRKLLS